MAPPYFCLRRVGNGWETSGLPRCTLGHRLEQSGGDTPEGIFAEWRWDGHRLRICNDRYGFYPLYYFVTKDSFGLSPSLPRLLAMGAPTDIDETALAVFLRIGFFLGEDTPFLGIRALPPNATLTWSEGRLQISSEPFRIESQALTRLQVIERYAALFRDAMRRRLPPHNDFVVPLTGGRDSRHILLTLCELGRKPDFCVTIRHIPPHSDEDARIATILASALDIPHHILDRDPARFAAESHKNALTNFCADEHTQLLPVADYLRGRTRAIYDGIGGDVLSAGLFFDEVELELVRAGRQREMAILFMDAKYNPLPKEADLEALLLPAASRRFSRERAIQRITQELCRHWDTPNPGGQFYFWNRTRREVALAPYALYDPSLQVYSPFLDHALYDFLASIPARELVDTQLHTATIAYAYPQYAHIPYQARYEPGNWKSRFSPDSIRRRVRDWGYCYHWTGDLLRLLASERSTLVDRSALTTRLTSFLLTGRGKIAQIGPMMQYLLELEGARLRQPL